MPLSPSVKKTTEEKLAKYCEGRIPEHIRDKLRIAFRFRGSSVAIFEERPPWREDMTEWTSTPVAQLRYNEKSGRWKLYWPDRNGRWHRYQGPERGLDAALEEIDRDPTHIFWG